MPIKKVNLGRGEARSLLQNDVSQMEWNFSIFFQSAFCAWLSPHELCVYALSSRAISSSHVRQAIRSLTLIQKNLSPSLTSKPRNQTTAWVTNMWLNQPLACMPTTPCSSGFWRIYTPIQPLPIYARSNSKIDGLRKIPLVEHLDFWMAFCVLRSYFFHHN